VKWVDILSRLMLLLSVVTVLDILSICVLFMGAIDGYICNLYRYLPFFPSLHPLWYLYLCKHIALLRCAVHNFKYLCYVASHVHVLCTFAGRYNLFALRTVMGIQGILTCIFYCLHICWFYMVSLLCFSELY
jgi:hypothetical protein